MPEFLVPSWAHSRSSGCKSQYPVQQQCQSGSWVHPWQAGGADAGHRVTECSQCPAAWCGGGGQPRLLLSSCAHVLPLLTGVPEGAVEPDPAGLREPHRGAQPVPEGCLGLGPESEGSEDCHPGQAVGECVVFHVFSLKSHLVLIFRVLPQGLALIHLFRGHGCPLGSHKSEPVFVD